MKNSPIGMFDSGVGGTSIWKEIHELLPAENSIYLADSKNAPYGEKSEKEILALSIKNTDFLIGENCKLIVVACNTATTNAIQHLRENYNIPFIGIEPAIKPAALKSESKTVGVLATKGTLASSLFHSTSENHASGIRIIEREGTGLVRLIEAGKAESEVSKELLEIYLEPMLEAGIDHLVLGCTHYPYLIPVLRKMLPSEVKIIDSGEAVARQTKAVLKKNNLLNPSKEKGSIRFHSNADHSILENFLSEVDSPSISYLDF